MKIFFNLYFIVLIIFIIQCSSINSDNTNIVKSDKTIGFISPCLPISIEYMNLVLFPINIITSDKETILSSAGSDYRNTCYWEESDKKSPYLKQMSTLISNFVIKSQSNNISVLLEKNKSIHGLYFPTPLLYNKLKKKFILFITEEEYTNHNGCSDISLSSLYLLDIDNNKLLKIIDNDVHLNNEIIYNNSDDSIYFKVSKDTDNNCEYNWKDKQFLYGYNIKMNKSIGYLLPKEVTDELLKR